MSTEISTNIRTLDDVLNFMAPFAGGSVPSSDDQEYTDWVRWIVNKQEEYARRAFWRRCLTREEITISNGDTTKVLPDRFNRPNALYMFIVDGVDWNEHDNTDLQTIVIEMNNDPDDENFAKWQIRFNNKVEEDATAIMWYFSNPPTPVEGTDVLILPGDMIGYAALSEYFRKANQEGSQDDARNEAENRMSEYLSIEMIPDKSELLNTRQNVTRKDYLLTAKNYYVSRTGRNMQS